MFYKNHYHLSQHLISCYHLFVLSDHQSMMEHKCDQQVSRYESSRALYSGAAVVPAMEIVRSVSSTHGLRRAELAGSWTAIFLGLVYALGGRGVQRVIILSETRHSGL